MKTTTQLALLVGLIAAAIILVTLTSRTVRQEEQVATTGVLETTIETYSPQDTETYLTQDNQTIMNETTATVTTNQGAFTLKLYSDLAPETVANFTKLVESGFYDGTRFHRIIDGFMIQGGDPLSKDEMMADRWGTGGPGYMFDDEIHAENKNVVGTISMANSGPNTNGSQFFVNVADNNFLDTKHTVFGEVTDGMEVIQVLSETATDGRDRPLDDVVIESITIQ